MVTRSTALLGAYVGQSVSAFDSFAAWLGTTPGIVIDYASYDTYSDMMNVSALSTNWSGLGLQTSFAVPMLPYNGTPSTPGYTLADAASGAYNAHYVSLADNLVSAGFGASIIRLGWEMNGNWFPWSIQNGNAEFASAFQQQVTAMRSAAGQAFLFDFNPACGSSYIDDIALDPAEAYPGDAYVDVIGMDIYDQSYVSNWEVFANRWSTYISQPYGLEWQRGFALAHGKRVSFPEWGLWPAGSNGGGDCPQFIECMYALFASFGESVAYQAYFDFSTSVLSSYPNSQAAYLRLEGGLN